MNFFKESDFKKFPTSSGIDQNVVGLYNGKVVRLIKEHIPDYKNVLSICSDVKGLIKSKLYYEDAEQLIIEHEKLEYITYFIEWTKIQKVEAAVSVIQIQKSLSEHGFFLFDPHAFNITFKNTEPVYFDFGSIKKGNVKPYIWFLKSFCGGFSKDYWDSVLKINIFQKIFIVIRLLLNKAPYDYLIKKVNHYESNYLQKIINLIIRYFPKSYKLLRVLSKVTPYLNSYLTNWSDYEQKEPTIQKDNPRVNNFVEITKKYLPERILDIGANKGAYSKLALSLGAQKAVCADLDENSLNLLMLEARNKKLPIWTVKLNLMDYPEKPGCYGTYKSAHLRFNSDFCICLAVVHHICYFGNNSFEEFAEKINLFATKVLIVEFIPYDDIHLRGPFYKGKDRSWYTTDNFIAAMKKYFPKDHEIYDSSPSPRILIKFEK